LDKDKWGKKIVEFSLNELSQHGFSIDQQINILAKSNIQSLLIDEKQEKFAVIGANMGCYSNDSWDIPPICEVFDFQHLNFIDEKINFTSPEDFFFEYEVNSKNRMFSGDRDSLEKIHSMLKAIQK